MAHDSNADPAVAPAPKRATKRATKRASNRAAKRWFWLLVIPWLAMIWVPSYNRIDPQLWGFPFFYWYQLLWVLVSSVITALVYAKTKNISKPGASQGRGGAQ